MIRVLIETLEYTCGIYYQVRCLQHTLLSLEHSWHMLLMQVQSGVNQKRYGRRYGGRSPFCKPQIDRWELAGIKRHCKEESSGR
jgi:hypothetical protein